MLFEEKWSKGLHASNSKPLENTHTHTHNNNNKVLVPKFWGWLWILNLLFAEILCCTFYHS